MSRNVGIKRRAVLVVAAGAVSGLAGCSNSNGGVENTERGNQDTTTATRTQNSETVTEGQDSSGTESSTEQENNESFPWEDDLENAIINAPLSDEYTTEPGGVPAEYIQLDDTSSQIDQPVSNVVTSNVDFEDETFLADGGWVDFDSAYFVITEDGIESSGDTTLYIWAPSSDRWDEGEGLSHNIDQILRGALTYSEDDIASFMEESITDYDDSSEDFPQEYLDMIEG